MFDEIANSDLSESHLPPTDADWAWIARFALAFDGYRQYGSFDRCAQVGNSWAKAFTERQALPESLTELRTCLFFEQRRWHHFGDTPNEESMAYIRALVERIRGKVLAGEFE